MHCAGIIDPLYTCTLIFIYAEFNGTLLNETDVTADNTFSSSQSLTCAQGFYVRNESSCRHLCSSWVNPGGVNADSIVTVASLINAVLSSTIVITLMLTLMRKEM